MGNNNFGAPTSQVQNPPNPDLRWERTGQFNLGVDLASIHNRLSGSLEYYSKKGVDLLGPQLLAPQTGIGQNGGTQFSGNTSSMQGRGVDVVLNSQNLVGQFHWVTNFLFSYNTDWVTKYIPITNNSQLVTTAGAGGSNAFVVGKPVHGLYSYRWAGLDSVGNPQGMLNGKVSENYSGIKSLNDSSQLKYSGPLTPRYFGSFRNTFMYKGFSLSFNITYKFGYYFRRNSVRYYNLFNTGFNYGTQDYAKRWQSPGDEKKTNVPSLIYPTSSTSRDDFYNGSEVLIDKGDHIRLQDIQLSYDLTKRQIARLPVQGIRLYLYANNIGIIWKANHDGIDPDAIPYNGSYYTFFPNPISISGGIKIDW